MFIPTKTYVKERSFDWANRIWIQKHAGIPGYPAKTIEQCSKGLLARSSDNGLYEQLPVYITPVIIDQQRFWITAQLVFGIDHQLYGHVALHPANSFLKLSFSEKKNWASSNVLIIFHINGKYSISKLPKGIEILDVFRRKSYSSYKKNAKFYPKFCSLTAHLLVGQDLDGPQNYLGFANERIWEVHLCVPEPQTKMIPSGKLTCHGQSLCL